MAYKEGGVMKSYCSGELKTGDIIITSVYSYLDLGIYLGPGSGKNILYYIIADLSYWMENKHTKKPHKTSIIYHSGRVMKYSADLITDEEKRKDYEKAIEALKLLNINVKSPADIRLSCDIC